MGDKLSRKEAKERTRQRLIDAVLKHVRDHGLHGLTTGRVADAAGIAQSSFYVHFRDMDEALRGAADVAGEELRAIVRAARLRMDFSNPETAYHTAYAGAVDALLSQRQFTELMLGHRRDRNSPLAESLRAAVDHIRADLVNDLRDARFSTWFTGDLEAYAELMVGMTFTATEAILDGRMDRDSLLRACARLTRELARAAMPKKPVAPVL